MKAHLRFFLKKKIQGRFILELSIHEVRPSEKYPDGTKYGLICIDLKTKQKVLMDNHHPKGPHIHINELELKYEYLNDEKLIDDFKQLVLKELGVKL
jgi:hypothetical protein